MSLVDKIPATSRAAEGAAADTASTNNGQAAFDRPSVFPRQREDEIRINEIFLSLQGESTRVGLPTVFVRLTGCPLRCTYCDTAYAFHEGQTRPIDSVLDEVARHRVGIVCVTGGEPLAQRSCLRLLTRLCDAGYSVSLETSGAIDVASVDRRVSRIVDIKTPGSGEVAKNRWDNLAALGRTDELKFVIASREDYEWSRTVLAERRLDAICPVLFSPVYGAVPPEALAAWILEDALPVRMQVQLHKIIWGERRGV